MIKLSFSEKLAYNFLHGESMSGIPEMALEALEDGHETPGLLVLAGLGKNESPFVIYEYYKQMLHELGLIFDKEQAFYFLARSVFNRVLNGDLDTFEACHFIFRNVIYRANLDDLDKHYVHDGVGLAAAYGLYDAMDDLMGNSTELNRSKEEAERLVKLEQETQKQLQEWLHLNP